MIKGWRNDPKWVEYYEKKSAYKVNRRMYKLQTEAQIDQMMMTIKANRHIYGKVVCE